MRELLFMPCDPPPPLLSTLRSVVDKFPSSLFLYPEERGLDAFKHSFLSLIAIGVLGVFAAREVGIVLSKTFGVTPGLLTLVVFIFLLEIYRRSGLQCTLWAWMVLYLIVLEGSQFLNKAAETEVGKNLGIDELPVAQRKQGGREDCMRLAACEISPVAKNAQKVQDKYEACSRCLEQGKLFDTKWKSVNGAPTFDGYGCTQRAPPFEPCKNRSTCPATRDVLEHLGEPLTDANVDAVCTEASGKLCVFARDGTTLVGPFGEVDPSKTTGLGYPTLEMCNAHRPNQNCAMETAGCDATDTVVDGKNCFCEQYKFRRSKNPCAFLETQCDKSSSLYAEAKVQVTQNAKLDVSDVVDAADLRNLVVGLDKALGFAS